MTENEKQIKKDEKEYKVLLGNVRAVMDTKPGQKVLWHILSLCGVYSLGDEGKREIGLEIIGLFEDTDPALYPNLLLNQRKTEL